MALVKELPKAEAELDKGIMKKSDRRRFFGLSLTAVSAAVALVIADGELISLFDNGYRSALGVAIVVILIACAMGCLSFLLARLLTQRV